MATVDQYLALITSAFRGKPNFEAVITALTSLPARVQDLQLQMMTTLFDLDDAVGDQLDIIGQWVGVSRRVAIPSTGIYFSWDGTDFTVGWDYGSWAPDNATTITVLPDDAYRTLIRAKIAANQWDGTTTGAYAIWEAVFPQFNILIIDHQNMSYDLAIVGGIVDSLTLALLTGGYIPLKPEAVRINEVLVPVDANPAFAWDIDPATALMAGWDAGSWLREIPIT